MTKDDDTITALVDAFETHGLTLGNTTRCAPTNHLGRFRKPELIAALHPPLSINHFATQLLPYCRKSGASRPHKMNRLTPLLFGFSDLLIVHQLTPAILHCP